MDYWRGYMDWPLASEWECIVCGARVLVWGFIHGICRCEHCHAEYAMLDRSKRVTVPISLLKDEYVEPAKYLWGKYHKPLDEYDNGDWDEALRVCPNCNGVGITQGGTEDYEFADCPACAGTGRGV